jgi:hypothetical protein
MAEEQTPGSAWRKSSFSGTTECVEIRQTVDGVHVRNSRERGGPTLTFTFEEWRAFLFGVTHEEFARHA